MLVRDGDRRNEFVSAHDPSLCWAADFRNMPLHALVLLGCKIEPDGRPSPAGQRRARALADAFHAGRAPLCVVSGGRRWHGLSEAEALMAELERLGVPARAMLPELRSLSTCENARGAKEVLAPLGATRVGVVTCDWHSPRALACFRTVGFVAEAIPAASPRMPLAFRARRRAREHVSYWVDRVATWGWSQP
jgi:uncharacterized SAM-binding protein YcdF (DUF218 family)